jgi:hypothetical protein
MPRTRLRRRRPHPARDVESGSGLPGESGLRPIPKRGSVSLFLCASPEHRRGSPATAAAATSGPQPVCPTATFLYGARACWAKCAANGRHASCLTE